MAGGNVESNALYDLAVDYEHERRCAEHEQEHEQQLR